MSNYLYILSFVSLLGWIFFLSLRYKKYATFYPLFVSMILITLLYLAGLLKILLPVAVLIFSLGFLLPIYQLIKNKITWQEVKSLPLSFYFLIIFGLLWAIFTANAHLFGWDEFAWGQFTKAILTSDNFYTTQSAIMTGKINYPPGIALYQYFFLRFSSFNESSFYFSQGILALSAVLPIFDLVGRNKKRLLIFALAIASVLVYFGPGLLSMTNDHIIGVIFAGAVLGSIFILRTNKSKLLLIPVIFALPLIKTTGIALSLIIVLIASLDIIITSFQQNRAHKLIKWKQVILVIMSVLILGLAAFFPIKSWDYYVQSQIGASAASIPSFHEVKRAFSVDGKESEKLTIKNFKSAVVSMPMNQQEGGFKLGSRPFDGYLEGVAKINHRSLTIPEWVIIFMIPLAMIIFFQRKEEKNISLSAYISLLAGLMGFLFLHLIAYLFDFSTYEGINLASMSRYINTYLLSFSLITIASIAFFMNNSSKGKKLLSLVSGLIFLYLLIFHTPPFSKLIIPPQIMAKSTDVVRDKTRPFSGYINTNTEKLSKTWVIYQNTNGWECMMIRYDIAPRTMQGGDGTWSLGDKYGPHDVWTSHMPLENWSYALLTEQYNYVYLAQADDNFWSHYADMFQDQSSAKSHQLFKVELKDEKAILVAK